MLKFFSRSLAVSGMILLTACGTLTPSQQATMTGGVVGAAAGTVSTVILGGCLPCGTAIGGAIGAGTGYAVEQINQQLGK